jgi:DNA mismatch repair protein MutL
MSAESEGLLGKAGATIRVLPEHLVNQIAAGEVIVRPANAVKELVDNALDAGAKQVVVRIEEGGRFIRVRDDGQGMARADAELALQRHATSKIRAFEDLYRLRTRGFRGEALASLAAVARLTIRTRQAAEEEGTQVRCEGGGPILVTPVGCPVGTEVEVRDLFYNTPARQAFMKTATAEVSAALAMVSRLAMGRPEVGFRVEREESVLLELAGGVSWSERCGSLLGIGSGEGRLLEVEFERGGVEVRGWIAEPTITAKDRRRQYFSLDGRPFSSKSLSSVWSEAMKGLVMVGRFPMGVLDIRVPDGEVDLNVHPTKEEIRFRRESMVSGAVFRAIQKALGAGLAGNFSFGKNSDAEPPGQTPASTPEIPGLGWPDHPQRSSPPSASQVGGNREGTGGKPPAIDMRPLLAPVQGLPGVDVSEGSSGRGASQALSPLRQEVPQKPWTVLSEDSGSADPGKREESRPFSSLMAGGQVTAAAHFPAPSDWSKPHPSAPPRPEEIPEGAAKDDLEPVRQWLRFSGEAPRVLGQVSDCFIIAQAGDALVLVDQHAAHERIVYARLIQTSEPIPSQPLLFPLTLDVPPDLVPWFHQVIPLLSWLGFDVSHFGGVSFLIQATPGDLVDRLDPMELVQDVVEDLAEGTSRGTLELDRMRDRIVTRMACRGAIKSGQRLSHPEMEALLGELARTPLGTNCPHGRPTLVVLSRTDLDKLFKRIV